MLPPMRAKMGEVSSPEVVVGVNGLRREGGISMWMRMVRRGDRDEDEEAGRSWWVRKRRAGEGEGRIELAASGFFELEFFGSGDDEAETGRGGDITYRIGSKQIRTHLKIGAAAMGTRDACLSLSATTLERVSLPVKTTEAKTDERPSLSLSPSTSSMRVRKPRI